MYYKIKLTDEAKRDLRRINNYLEEYKLEKVYKKIKQDISNLKFMPRTHKTLISSKDRNGEYRRIVSGNYIIIYQLQEEQVNILRIFNQKENYLYQEKFILKEYSNKYFIKSKLEKIF